MRSLELTIPGKTFLAGEYLALKGLGALVLATKPRFKMQIKELAANDVSRENPFHGMSPAGLFWQEQFEFFKRYHFSFKTFSALGGWGASTAEFISLHALWQMKDSLWIEEERFFDLHQMLSDYRRLASGTGNRDLGPSGAMKAAGFPPSGADLVGQVRGGLTYFEGQHGKIQTFSWPFVNLKMRLVTTGKKLPTHEHLASLKDFATEDLAAGLAQCHLALKSVDEDLFLAGIQQTAKGLLDLGFVAPETLRLLKQFELPGVLASKGCGALGADVIALFFQDPEVGSLIDKTALELGLTVVATESSLTEGLNIQKSFKEISL